MRLTRRGLVLSELKPAPGELRIVQQLVNTTDRIQGSEVLASPRALASWLDEVGLLDPGADLTPADLERTIAAREALRALLAANNGGPAPDAAAGRLDLLGHGALLRVRVAADGATRLEAAGEGVDRALGRLLAIVTTAQGEGTWPRLKACAEPACRAAFYDFSPNRAGLWCAMRRCGNRFKAQVYRRRQKRR